MISMDLKNKFKKFKTRNKRLKVFSTKDCNKESSLDLCKMIMNLLTLDAESKIQSISLYPIVLKQSDLDYLDFWFNNEYGIFDAKNEEMSATMILVDLYCVNQSA